MSHVVDSITKRFGAVVAIDRASIVVERGRIFGLLGANGAGKTTTIYRAGVLLYGQRVGLTSVWRATRVSR